MKLSTKQQYEQVVTSVNSMLSTLQGLEISLDETDLNRSEQITLIENTLLSIEAAAQDKLDEIEQQQVMTNFLSELKVVFDKYTAKIELGSDVTGYGEAYGEGETAVGIKFTATFEGVTSSKEINKSVIVSGDLV